MVKSGDATGLWTLDALRSAAGVQEKEKLPEPPFTATSRVELSPALIVLGVALATALIGDDVETRIVASPKLPGRT